MRKRLAVGIASKRAFDPYYQKRKDPIKEMVEKDNKKRKKKGKRC